MSNLRRVTFSSWGLTIVGNLYTPPSDAPGRRKAAIVLSHPQAGVKEQTVALYARSLADQGFVALTFDAAYQGESEGKPRGYENPYQRVEDVKSAVSHLTTLVNEVDSDRIGALGICASGGFVPNSAQGDVRIKAVATISAADLGRLAREGLRPKGSIPQSQVNKTLLASTNARSEEARGSPPQIVDLLPDDSKDIPQSAPDLIKEGWDYYKTPRGSHPRSDAKQPLRSNDMLVNYDSFAFNRLISPRPLLMIVGSDADTKYHSEEAIELAKEPKELFVVQGKTHVGLYDDLSETMSKLLDFYANALAGEREIFG